MAVEYDISSDVAVIKETGSVSQCARVTQMYSGQITYDDEAGSKFATATINGKSQRVMLCIAVSGTVTYDDVPSLYSTVDGHRCLNIVTPTETGTPDDVPSLYETVVIDGQNVRAVRCIMINKTPVYDGVSSVCTFTGDDGKTHTAQLVNKVTGGSVVVIIKGTSPLNLPDAIANSLSYVKAFGGTEQNGAPTPDAPMDIISNNGVLKVGQAVTIDPTRNYAYINITGSWAWSSDSYSIALPVEVGKRYKIDITNTDAAVVGTIFRYGFVDEDPEDFKQSEVTPSPANISVYDYWRGTPQELSSVTVTATHPYLVIQFSAGFASSVVSTYLTVKKQVVYADGTVETINMHGKNLWNGGDITTEKIISGVWERYGVQNNIGNGTWSCKHCTNIPAGTWTISFVGSVSRVVTYDGTSTVVYMITAGARKRATVTLPTDGEIWLFCANASAAAAVADIMVELGSTATEYEPYYNGGTATAEMLLKVGDYQDVQSIIDGVVTRNVGVKVLDGTEEFNSSTLTNCWTLTRSVGQGNFTDRTVYCTHFNHSTTLLPVSDRQGYAFIGNSGGSYAIGFGATTRFPTQEQFKQWLADQYAAGTPVTVYYPLAIPATESVAGQHLQVTGGDNVLEITQASLIGLELEAQYSAAVSLTIQEVQDANLDPNVQVTIQ